MLVLLVCKGEDKPESSKEETIIAPVSTTCLHTQLDFGTEGYPSKVDISIRIHQIVEY